MGNSYSLLRWIAIISIVYASLIKSNVKEETQQVVKIQTSSTATLIALAKSNLGKPYVYGKTGESSFDCSGFVYAMYKKIGIQLPRTSLAQSEVNGHKIPRNLLEEGDLLFFDTSGKGYVNHSAIYLGDGKFIHASSGKANSVTISSLDGWYKDKFKWGKRLTTDRTK